MINFKILESSRWCLILEVGGGWNKFGNENDVDHKSELNYIPLIGMWP